MCYPGIFAYLQANMVKPSAARATVLCLAFALGILSVAAVLVVVLVSVNVELRTLVSPATGIVNTVGFIVLTAIGIAYILGKAVKIPVPRINPPNSLTRVKGIKGAVFYGIFLGGPGQAHCTITLLVPLVFLSVSSLTGWTILYFFMIYVVGRVIPLLIIGLALEDIRTKLVRRIATKSYLINRLIGAIFLVGGVVLFFTI
jgi:cytochrome c biogenesis protein CcdA